MSQNDRILWLTQPLLEFEVETLPWTMAEVSSSGRKDLKSLIRRFLDYFSPSTEQSILSNLDLQELKKKYFILEEFQLIASDQDDQITELSEGYIAFYDEALRSGLRFSLHPFFSNILDFYRLHPTQVIPNAIGMIIVFIICYKFFCYRT